MTTKDALTLIDSAIGKQRLDRDAHIELQRVVNLAGEVINNEVAVLTQQVLDLTAEVERAKGTLQ